MAASSARKRARSAVSERERALIDAMVARVPHPPDGLSGPGDDAARVAAGPDRVVTTDLMVEGTHFVRAHPPGWLGWKLLAVNLSDVAAMGATPEGFTVSAALPSEAPMAWWEALAGGVGELARQTGALLVGGDVVRSCGPVMLSVTAWGTVVGGPLCRTGGRAGDRLMVAGALGRAGAGCRRWLDGAGTAWGAAPPEVDACVRAHLRPEPPLWAGPWALSHGATAGMDLSDGLAVDAPRLASASGVGLDVELDRLPSDPALPEASPLQRAAGGEDYGLLCLVPARVATRFRERGFADLGAATGGPSGGVRWWQAGSRVEPGSLAFHHFAGE